jgi:hypothetical protein
MRSAPSGPRTRQPNYPSTNAPAGRPPATRPAADRDQVFASIFGRQAAGHHAASSARSGAGGGQGYEPTPNSGGYGGTGMMPPAGSGYEQFAPPLPPGMGPVYHRPSPASGQGQAASSGYGRDGMRDLYTGGLPVSW